MAGKRVGEAWIAVGPSFRGFRAKTEAWVKANMRPVKVPVEVDPKSKRPITLPDAKPVKARVDVDRSRFDRSLSAIENRLDRLSRGRFLINVGIAASPMASPILGAAAGGLLAGGGIGAGLLGGGGAFAGVGAASLKRVTEAQKTNSQAQAANSRAAAAAAKSSAAAARSAAAERAAAARQVQTAEKALAAATDQVRISQDRVRESMRALHDARRQAIRDLQDLREKSTDNALTIESAEIGLIDAQAELAKVQSTQGASALDLRKAKLGVAEAEDRLSDARRQSRRDAVDLAAAEKEGVEGSDQVVAARKQVTAARRDVKDARAEVQSARADLRDARASAASAGRVEAEAVAAQTVALQKLTPAQQAAANSVDRLRSRWAGFLNRTDPVVLGALSKGMNALGIALRPLETFLTPVARGFGAIFDQLGRDAGSKGANRFAKTMGVFSSRVLADAAQGTRNLAKGFGNLLVAFMPLSTDMSGGLVKLTDRFAKWTAGLSDSKGFQEFTDYVRTNGPLLLSTLGAIGRAFIDVLVAAAPLGGKLLRGLRSFAKWVSSFAEDHPKVTSFAVGFVALSSAVSAAAGPLAKMVPLLRGGAKGIGLVGSATKTGWKVGRDFVGGLRDQRTALKSGASWATTFGSAVRQGASNTLRSAKSLATYTKAQTMAGVAATRASLASARQGAVNLATAAKTKVVTFATKAWALATKGATLAMNLMKAAFLTSPWGVVIVGLVAVGAALVLAYKKVGWFRAGVQASWKAITVASKWAWSNVLKPVFRAIGWYIGNVLVPQYRLMWTVVKAVFGWIGDRVRWVWRNLLKPVFSAMRWYIRDVLGPVYSWLWTKVVRPVFGWIGDRAKWMWGRVLKPAFNATKTGVGKLGDAFVAVKKRIGDAWDGLKNLVRKPLKFSLQLVNSFVGAVNDFIPGNKFNLPKVKIPKGWRLGGRTLDIDPSRVAGVVHGREMVINAASTRRLDRDYGPDFLDSLNGYKGGGRVRPTKFPMNPGTYRGHTGVDFAAPMGSDVFAVQDGKIISTPRLGFSYGHHIREAIAGARHAIYAHLSKIFVKPGQNVKAGQRIGLSGSTGNSTGPHLHLTVGPPDTYANTLAWLGGANTPKGGKSGGGIFGGLFNAFSDLKSWISSKFRSLVTSKVADGGLFGRGPARAMLKPIPGALAANLKDRVFDSGGLATTHGLLVKNTIRPERVLGPSSTVALDEGLRNLGRGLPDMPIVDGSQIIGYLRDVATDRARIEIAANNQRMEQEVFN